MRRSRAYTLSLLLPCIGIAVLAMPTAPVAPAKSSSGIPGLSWTDLNGHRFGAGEFAKHKATAFIFSSAQCPVSNYYTPRILALSKEFNAKGVKFFLVDSNREDTKAVLAQYVKERAIPFPAVKDDGLALADALQAHVT